MNIFYKSFFRLGILCVCMSCNSRFAAAQHKTTRAEMKLNGEVKSILEVLYAATDTNFHADNPLISKTLYKFDRAGFVVGIVSYNEKEKLTGYVNYIYDSVSGLKMEERCFFPDSALKEFTKFKYDMSGNLIEERVYGHKDTLKAEVVNRYDPKAKEESEDDSDDEKIEIVITNRTRKPDKFGNWTQQFTFEKKVPVSVTTREIEYFLKAED